MEKPTKKEILDYLEELQKEGKLQKSDHDLIALIESRPAEYVEAVFGAIRKNMPLHKATALDVNEAVRMIESDKYEVQEILPRVPEGKREEVLARLREKQEAVKKAEEEEKEEQLVKASTLTKENIIKQYEAMAKAGEIPGYMVDIVSSYDEDVLITMLSRIRKDTSNSEEDLEKKK